MGFTLMVYFSHIARTMVIVAAASCSLNAQENTKPVTPLVRTVDLNIGESVIVSLADGSKAKIKLKSIDETQDTVRFAVRRARVVVEINDQLATLISATYHLPMKVAGLQIEIVHDH